MTKRLPTILSKGIEDVYKTLNQETDEDVITDLVECVHRMDTLMDDLRQEATLRPIIDDGAGDIPLWNKVSEERGPHRGHRRPTDLPLSLLLLCQSLSCLQEIAKYFQGKSFTSAPW